MVFTLRTRLALSVCLTLLTLGCGGASTPDRTSTPASARAAGAAPEAAPAASPAASPQAPAHASRPRLVFLGDSLTAGLGLQVSEAYPTLVQQKVDSAGLDYEVVNAGVSGDTSAGGLSRLDWALEGDVKVMLVALGGNDGLRGLPPDELKKNLATIIERAQATHITVLLAGMEAPPNFGQTYTEQFRAVYPALAAQYHVTLIPFLLQGVAGIERLNQRDGIHPTAEGARIVADTVWSALRPALRAS